jgi:hypothetical protein
VGAAVLAAPSVLLSVGERTPDPEAVSVMRAGAAVVLSVFAAHVATLVMLSTVSLGRPNGAFSGWLVVLTYVIGVTSFADVSIATPTVCAVPA